MVRLIDANALAERLKLQYCKDCNNYNEIRCRACNIDDTINFIEDAPTVDAVEVVRCKDCRYCENLYPIQTIDEEALVSFCRLYKASTQPNGFCSCGKGGK